MLDYNSMDNNSDLEKPMQNPNTAMKTFQKSIPAVIIMLDIKIDHLGYSVENMIENNCKLSKVNEQLTKEILTLKQDKKEQDDLYAGKREQFMKKISLLEKKIC